MRIADENNIDILRQKAVVLENENKRLVSKLVDMQAEILKLQKMTPEDILLNLPGIVEQTISPSPPNPGGSEQRHRHKGEDDKKPKAKHPGHGPTKQLKLPRTQETYGLDNVDMACPCCGEPLVLWKGHDEVSELIRFHHYWEVAEIHKLKYCCSGCDHIETADGPQKLIPGGRYSPEVAIQVALGKFQDAMPISRQVREAWRKGAKLTNQALWDQQVALFKLTQPIVTRIKTFLQEQHVLGCDESPFKYLSKGITKKWQAWQLSCPQAAYFEIHDSKSAEAGFELLEGFKGILMVDGAAAYTSLASRVDCLFTLVNCWSHARRKLLAANKEAPGQVEQALEFVDELYIIERDAVVEGGPPGNVNGDEDPRSGYRRHQDLDKLRALRDERSRQVCIGFKAWILKQTCIPGGLLKKALGYIADRWSRLTLFLDDPLIPLDNNRTEGGYVNLAIGRRNYIGARSLLGTQVAAHFYTIFESIRVCGGNPEAYLRYATYTMLADQPPLLPHQWVEAGSPEPDMGVFPQPISVEPIDS